MLIRLVLCISEYCRHGFRKLRTVYKYSCIIFRTVSVFASLFGIFSLVLICSFFYFVSSSNSIFFSRCLIRLICFFVCRFLCFSFDCFFTSVYFTLSPLPAQDLIPYNGSVQKGSRAHPASYPLCTRGPFLRDKPVWARTWPLTFIEVKNAWSQTSMHHTYSWHVAE
jgi:hypothetical protein